MRITQVRAWPVTMRLQQPYAIAYDVLETASNVFVELVTDGRFAGFGCAAPDEHVTGETPQGVLADLHSVAEPLLRGADPLRPARLVQQLRAALPHSPGVVAAVDMALFDILGKASGLPLWRLLGGYRDSIATSITIGILPEGETVAQARQHVRDGFRALKLKGGLDVEEDISRVIRVREAVGEGVELRFDANQGYRLPQALRFLDQTRRAKLRFIEQPTPQAEPEMLAEICGSTAVPVMADESLLGPDDALRLIRGNCCRMFNVKLMKTGGILAAGQIAALAGAAKIEVMTGCMDESALGIAAGLHFSLASPAVTCADLDGHFGLQGDPAQGAVLLHNGLLYPSDKPGLGCDPAG